MTQNVLKLNQEKSNLWCKQIENLQLQAIVKNQTETLLCASQSLII